MRLVLANPHYYSYGKTLFNVLLRRKSVTKYHYFLSFYLKDPKRSTAIYIDGAKTSLAAANIRFPFWPKLFVSLELWIWMFLNGLNPFKQKVYYNLAELDPSTDVLVDFSRVISAKLSEEPKPFQGLSIIFLTHYFLHSQDIAAFIQKIPHPLLVAENNLVHEAYFRKFFPFVDEVYQLPYAFAPRFLSAVPFEERKNKCLAVGSISPVAKTNQSFIDFFQTNFLQPMRKTIADRHTEYPEQIDSLIRQFENFSFKNDTSDDSFFYRMVKQYAPVFVQKIVLANRHQRYYRFNIVKKFNEYRMFVSPEEIVGLPPINAFEGMACGSAFIGIDDPMYTNLGLIPGTHYISYQKGDFHDLIAKIRYYQERPEELESIAKAGKNFVQEHFNQKKIADTFWSDLENMFQHFASKGHITLTCSFQHIQKPKS